MAAPGSKGTVVLVHGLWMSPLCWEEWIPRLQSRGYEVLAPGWPGVDDRTVEDIRANPQPMANKSIEEIVDAYAAVITALPKPPIVIGHSFGGLFTQILLSRGLGAAGVGISPAQPAGILALPFSTLKASFPVLSNPFDYKSTVRISPSEFHFCFGNHLSLEESKKLYDRYAIPSVAHVLWQGALSLLHPKGATHVEFDKSNRAPLLLIAGTNDNVVPKSVVAKEFAAYQHGSGLVEYKEFEGRTHGIVNQKGWEDVLDFALDFVEKNVKN
ncbi:Arylesterase [Pleurostoma richardsiae]|uniref:Arylesterase n=1 Tax=Pleurostoma richardsiae TaxID=41990 RepID=A0AA38RQI6_9PEZI|nr:Arylesterase [Pleurostoma richardsiae]